MDSFVSSVYFKISFASKYSFAFSFLIWIPLISLFCLIAIARTFLLLLLLELLMQH